MMNCFIANTNRNDTHFIDFDGTIIKHQGNIKDMLTKDPEILPNVLETITKWYLDGDIIVITTARLPEYRSDTLWQLEKIGIYRHMYLYLLMGVSAGCRRVWNDAKPDMPETAFGHTLPRNSGFPPLT